MKQHTHASILSYYKTFDQSNVAYVVYFCLYPFMLIAKNKQR